MLDKVTCPKHRRGGIAAKSLTIATIILTELHRISPLTTRELLNAVQEHFPDVNYRRTVVPILAGLLADKSIVESSEDPSLHGFKPRRNARRYALCRDARQGAAKYATTRWCERCRLHRYVVARYYGFVDGPDADNGTDAPCLRRHDRCRRLTRTPQTLGSIAAELGSGVTTCGGTVTAYVGARPTKQSISLIRLAALDALRANTSEAEYDALQTLLAHRGRPSRSTA